MPNYLTRVWQCPSCNRTSRSDRSVRARFCPGAEVAPCSTWCDLVEDRDDEPARGPAFSAEAAVRIVDDILRGVVVP
jgi:hypothetical protein